jgi:hypothetical protein
MLAIESLQYPIINDRLQIFDGLEICPNLLLIVIVSKRWLTPLLLTAAPQVS